MAEKIELAKAYVQVVPTTQGIGNSLRNELKGETDSASEAAGKSGGSRFAFGFKTAASVVAGAAMAAVGTAVTGLATITKAAVSNYAEYEQLVGGVETLFKDSANIVQQYATEAYKNAGISANQYMETVTSFSASLLQSLDGDTAMAAQVADRAIRDMSDNANKMGTDMSSIQNAYQGFAKQNYTMLDNLKLGYGGTKEEMARLIKEASQMKDVQKELGITVDENSMSFGNIVNAISVMQKHMDIAGATSNEAMTTISGSANMMKAAWQDLLTQMAAGDTINFGAFTDSVKTFLGNLVPLIQETIPNVANVLSLVIADLVPLIPEIMGPLLPAISDGIMMLTWGIVGLLPDVIDVLIGILPELVDAILSVVPMLINAFTAATPQLLEAGFMILSSLIDGVIQALPTLIPETIQIIFDLVDKITSPEAINNLINAALDIMIALTDGIINAIPELVSRLPEVILSLVNTLTSPENLNKILQSAVKMILKLAEGLIRAIPQLLQAVPKIIKAVVDGIKNAVGQMAQAGIQLVQGLWQGLTNSLQWIKDKISGWVGNVLGFIKGLFGIRSPSREMAWVGEMLDRGLAEGIEDNVQPIRDAMDDITDETMGRLDSDIMVDGALGATGSAATGQLGVLIATVADLSAKLDRMQIVLDSGELVGGIKNRMDAALGDNSVAAGRMVAYA